jgi:hypothetical protein
MHFPLCAVLTRKWKKILRVKRHHGSMFSRRLSKNFRVGRITQTHFGNVIDIEALFTQKRGKVNPNMLVQEQLGRIVFDRFIPLSFCGIVLR